jgi:DNA-binding protein HU-beta
MNKQDIIDYIAKQTGSTKTDSSKVVDAFLDAITAGLSEGNDVILTGFLSLKVKERKARTGRNPRTGAPIQIPASKVVSLSAGKKLKDAVKAKTAPKKKK